MRASSNSSRVSRNMRGLSAVVGVLLVLAAIGGGTVWAEPEPALLASEVTLVPGNGVALQGGQLTVDVRIGHVGYLAGYSFRLWFDPTLLQVVDSDPSTSGTQAGIGDIFAAKQSVDIASVNNTTGRIDYSSALVGINDYVTIPAPQTASLAKITFQLVDAGTSQLEFDLSAQTTNLSDRHADPIACNWVDGQLTAVAATDHLYVPLVARNWH